MPRNTLLVINAGSATTKFSVFALQDKPKRLYKATLPATYGIKKFITEHLAKKFPDAEVKAVGHRLVHGGLKFTTPVRLDKKVMAALEALVPLAPLHLPPEIKNIKEVSRLLPDVVQFGCFDTAFHATQTETTRLFPLPQKYAKEGIIHYGFHGLSYEYIASVLPTYAKKKADKKVIAAHLGGGASLCAMEKRKSVATTMSFTGLDGLMMATRSGAIDPGVILHLLSEKKMSINAITNLLYKESGLLGVSGISGDMRVLEKSRDAKAKQAIALFCHRATQEMGALIASLKGLDVLVFTAGIGENSALVRKEICTRLSWLGVEIDAKANQAGKSRISKSSSKVDVYVIPTDEEQIIASKAESLLRRNS